MNDKKNNYQVLKPVFEHLEKEHHWYTYWLKNNFFRKINYKDKKFSVVIPPPNITGLLHIGHALNCTLQDIIIRYRTMQGYYTLWIPGTDHAGIATQNIVEKELFNIKKITKNEIGRENFIKIIWEWKEKFSNNIINQLKKLGCSCDWSKERFTMDNDTSKAVKKVFVRLFNDKLIYQDNYIVNWCPNCHTAISDLEVEFVKKEGFLWYIQYNCINQKDSITVATTRPETILGDIAIAVNPNDLRYKYLIGKKVLLPIDDHRIIEIISDKSIKTDFGSGAVKITPACDINDFLLAKKYNLPIIPIMDNSANINKINSIYYGQNRYLARKNIIEDLKKNKHIVKIENYIHNVGKCSRCGEDIEPYISKQWFIKTKSLAKNAILAIKNSNIKLIPTIWENTYYEWMSNIRDWCISRQIWWGHRIPVWYCKCGEIIASTEEQVICSKCNNTNLTQDQDVLDTWFSSALWPFSSLGWPEKTKDIKIFYPTTLLITGFDILFFWVARMIMIGLYCMKTIPFQTVYLHALVRDKDGNKMSKSKGNVINPVEMVEKFGADSLRFALAISTVQGRDITISEEKIKIYRNFINKIWNAAKFTLINIKNKNIYLIHFDNKNLSLVDKWIQYKLNDTIYKIINYLDNYRFNDAAAQIYHFIWNEFCDWYIELIKPILYSPKNVQDRIITEKNLYFILTTIIKLLHPFMPFITEEIWHNLVNDGSSIMQMEFPKYQLLDIEYKKAHEKMNLIITIINSIRNIRGEININPLEKIKVILSTTDIIIYNLILDGQEYIKNIARIKELEIKNYELEEKYFLNKTVSTGILDSIKIFVFLDSKNNSKEEIIRLKKQKLKILKDLSKILQKLSDINFKKKASLSAIEKVEIKHKELEKKLNFLHTALNKIEDKKK